MSKPLEQRLSEVRNQIKSACEIANREMKNITLIAVSKTHPVSAIKEAISAGAKVFGENKIQEAESKILEIGHDGIEWHLIGHLQSNKVRKAVKLFDVIHTIDSIELAKRLERICIEENRAELRIFIQVDLGKEETKVGISKEDLPELIEFIKNCQRLKVEGLMQIPPYFDDTEKVRPYFRELKEIRDKLLPSGKLSMGMSHDFQIAIEEGATDIRIGTAIFGERDYQK